MLAELDASESAVYDALASLKEHGITRETGSEWALTARGRIVANRALDLLD